MGGGGGEGGSLYPDFKKKGFKTSYTEKCRPKCVLNLIGFLSFKISQIVELISIQARKLGGLMTGCTFVYR